MANRAFSLSSGALSGAVAAIAVFGAFRVSAQDPQTRKSPPVDGWVLSGGYDAANWPGMRFTLNVENAEKAPRDLAATVKLVRQEFKGNPGSRVVRPEDNVTTLLETQSLRARIEPGKSQRFDVVFAAKPDTGEEPKEARGFPRITYLMQVEIGGQVVHGVAARQPVNLSARTGSGKATTALKLVRLLRG